MNIRDLNLGPSRLETTRSGSSDAVRGKEEGTSEATASTGAAPSSADRIEISDGARAAASSAPETPELAFARKALYGIPPLSQERIADIFQRINEGFYSTPEVIKSVAERASNDILGSGNPAAL